MRHPAGTFSIKAHEIARALRCGAFCCLEKPRDSPQLQAVPEV
jgi:hypothetical protein